MVHRAARGHAQVYQLSPNSGLQVYGVRTFRSPGVRCRNVLILNFTLCTKSPRCTVYELLINSAPQVNCIPTFYLVHRTPGFGTQEFGTPGSPCVPIFNYGGTQYVPYNYTCAGRCDRGCGDLWGVVARTGAGRL